MSGHADTDAALMRLSSATQDGFEALHQLLESRHYRLTWWRNAPGEINWRRFFDVSDLAYVRFEQGELFESMHALILRLHAQGLIDGVRVDHVDGLPDPDRYCRKLRQRLTELTAQRPSDLRNMTRYIIVEKIIGADAQLRADWGVDDTTGYEVMDQVGALLHDPAGDLETEALAARRQLIAQNFVGEFDALARALHVIARADFRTRDMSLPAIRRALTELLVHFPVYPTYAGVNGRNALDPQTFDRAAGRARQSLCGVDRPLLDPIGCWLGGDAPGGFKRSDLKDICLLAITRFQQLTPPLAAKSVEDTAFYRYGRLVSCNEVGVDPAQDFHAADIEHALHGLNTLLAAAPHDHKRGEDVRACIAVLSEMPRQWEHAVRRCMSLNASLPTESAEGHAPDAADERMLYQMPVGAWPLVLVETNEDGVRAFADRINQWQTKALREGDLFARLAYQPLTVHGERSGNVIAFLRRYRDRAAIATYPAARTYCGEARPNNPRRDMERHRCCFTGWLERRLDRCIYRKTNGNRVELLAIA